MARQQPPVMIVLDQMMIGVARKRERIEPESVNGGLHALRKPRSQSGQMRKVMAQNVVTDQMPCIFQSGLQTIQRGGHSAFLAANWRGCRAVDRSHIEHARSLGIDLEVN